MPALLDVLANISPLLKILTPGLFLQVRAKFETGFTVQINNYDNLFTWSATATAGGSVAISNTGLITVTGLSASTTSVLAVTSLRAGYANGRATLTQTTSSS